MRSMAQRDNSLLWMRKEAAGNLASQPLNGRDGERARGKRLFQSSPTRGAGYRLPHARGLSPLRKRDGQNGGRHTRPDSPSEPFLSAPLTFSLEREQASGEGCSN